MIYIDANMKMPSCCNECQLCSCQKIGLFYCDITTNYIDVDSDERDADCPLKEVPKAKWEYAHPNELFSFKCSNCGGHRTFKSVKDKYCPNCGAKMN